MSMGTLPKLYQNGTLEMTWNFLNWKDCDKGIRNCASKSINPNVFQ